MKISYTNKMKFLRYDAYPSPRGKKDVKIKFLLSPNSAFHSITIPTKTAYQLNVELILKKACKNPNGFF